MLDVHKTVTIKKATVMQNWLLIYEWNTALTYQRNRLNKTHPSKRRCSEWGIAFFVFGIAREKQELGLVFYDIIIAERLLYLDFSAIFLLLAEQTKMMHNYTIRFCFML